MASNAKKSSGNKKKKGRRATAALQAKLPVTLISGFLGSGKTTLLEHILKSKEHGLRCAVIVNDMAEINIDGALLEKSELVQTKEKLVQMQNGCICCTLREDLLEEVNRLAAEGNFDYLVIESTGISEPMQVAETFTTAFSAHMLEHKLKEQQSQQEQRPGEEKTSIDSLKALQSLADTARLDTCVTVVDASTFYTYFHSPQFLDEAFEGAENEVTRTVVDLLVDQIEFSDVILLNKLDVCSREQADKVMQIIRGLNKLAKIIPCTYSKVEVREILNTGLFNMTKAMASSGWLQSLKGEIIPETEEYGISSFVYRQRRAFHPQRLYELIRKGFFIICNAGSENKIEEIIEEDENVKAIEEKDENKASISEFTNVEKKSEPEQQKQEVQEMKDMKEKDTPEEKKNESAEQVGEMKDMKEKDTPEEKKNESAEQVIPTSQTQLCLESKTNSVFKHVLRSKGFIWIAGKDTYVTGWSQAGLIVTIAIAGYWYAAMPGYIEQADPETRKKIMKDFLPGIGDRKQELVFIGDFKDKAEKDALTKALDYCLMREGETVAPGDDPWGYW